MYTVLSSRTEINWRRLNHARGDTRQILDNLWREDKGRGPKVSSVRRFYCTSLTLKMELVLLHKLYCIIGISKIDTQIPFKDAEHNFQSFITSACGMAFQAHHGVPCLLLHEWKALKCKTLGAMVVHTVHKESTYQEYTAHSAPIIDGLGRAPPRSRAAGHLITVNWGERERAPF